MKVPDKIKIGKYNITSDGDVVFGWVTNEPDCEAMQHDIEYTRTDAFIEKAKVWLEKNADKYIWYSDYAESPGDDMCGMNDDFVKDFANYMKGE